MKEHRYFVYILTNAGRTVLYTGVTNDLARRLQEHAGGTHDGFTKKYRVRHLLYYEEFGWIQEAIAREKQIKSWPRRRKEALVGSVNPGWVFLEGSFRNVIPGDKP
ncbi:GIY-YIG nuclease family protein [Flaviaesturariibacter flavus]|uniref:GIY-YIG nuclease family protein n=1 Tax=Flaviaesturariibacter flavus TaxID=2502780 RepID=A0A4R1BAF1_9BACT|nr:GIY-YIG nuclease family protein [Flaviaesturariibacter flavus]TCJ13946.1 GIY-YIG nuclease family protein [Flaviaesturariibacter flavus]